MENAIALKQSYVPQENDFQTMQIIARNAAASGLYAGVGSEQKILMVLLAAQELGIKPMTALNGGLWNIQGKIEISARLMNAMVRKAGHSICVKHCDATKCILEGKRSDNGDTFTSQFTIEDAQRAGLASRAVWKSYAEDMLYSRAMSRLARRLFPDIIGTAYVEGEIRDAKCEIISTITAEEGPENAEEAESRMIEFLKDYPESDHQWIRSYIQKYAAHWKKKIVQSIDDYSDREKFLTDFQKWKKREESKSQSQA